MARLEKWSIVGLGEDRPLAVRGEIHGDDRFADGTPITSSRLHFLDPAGRIASTRNHTYELGAISDAFARWMADQGKSIAGYARTLESRPATTPPPAAPRIAVAPAPLPKPLPVLSDATVVVQDPTRLVAAT